jgi:hypothetical protein
MDGIKPSLTNCDWKLTRPSSLNLHYQKELRKVKASTDFVVESKKLREIFDLVYQVAKWILLSLLRANQE